MSNKPEEFKEIIKKNEKKEFLTGLFLGSGLGIFGNIAAEYLGYMARLKLEEFLKLPITYHSYGIVGSLAFFYMFYWLWFKIMKKW